MPNIWKISPGRNAYFWDRCRDEKCISINWLEDLDLTGYSREDITNELKRRKEGKSGSASSIWAFVNLVKPKDIVIANKGLYGIVGIGVVRTDYLRPNHPKNPNRRWNIHRHVHLVDWKVVQPTSFKQQMFNQGTVHRVGQREVERIKYQYLEEYPELAGKLKLLFPSFLWAGASGAADDNYIPDDEDTRTTAERQIKIRRGQPKFRSAQLRRFRETCAITGCQVLDLLEAAHISPYRGEKDNAESNGILLRTDIHTLFDLNLLSIEPKSQTVILARSIRNVADYGLLHGRSLKRPRGTKLALTAIVERYNAFVVAEKEREN